MSSRNILVILGILVLIAGIALFLFLSMDDEPDQEAAPTTTTSTTTQAPDEPSTTSADSDPDTSQGGSGDYEPVFEEDDCEFELVTSRPHRCGWLVVPEDRADPDGAEVRIHVAVFESADPDAPDDPVVYLDGGPGGETLDTLQFSLEPTWGPFIDNRDVIFFDQRGVGYSTPSLECPESRELTFEILDDDLSGAEYAARDLEATEACHERLLSEGADLTRYNSATNAADVADLRVALGIDEWNLFGISYGTRLAQTVMRDHPEGVRSVILDSTYSPQEDLVATTPANLVRAFEELWSGCEADPGCAAAYPDLEDRFWALRDRLDADPLYTDVTDVFTQEDHRTIVNGDTLIGTFFQGLYSAETIPVLPKIVADLEQGDTAAITRLLTNNLANGAFFSWGMNLSVQCNEEIPFVDEDEVATAATEADPRLGDYFEGATNVGPAVFDLCDLWQAGTADPVENEPVASDLPTLVMAGQYDPITPPEWGARAAEHLRNGTYLEFPSVGHAASVSGDCPLEVALAFFDDPTASPDDSCIASMDPVDFAVAGEQAGGEVELVPFEEELFGVTVSGVRPDGWDPLGNGAWARGDNALDATVIVQQAAPVELDAAQALDLLLVGVAFESDPVEVATVDAPGRAWTVYEGVVQGDLTLVGIGPGDGTTGMVIMSMAADERDDLYETVMVPAMEAFTTG